MNYKRILSIAVLAFLFSVFAIAEVQKITPAQNGTNYSLNISGQPAIYNYTTLINGSNITITQDTANHTITINSTGGGSITLPVCNPANEAVTSDGSVLSCVSIADDDSAYLLISTFNAAMPAKADGVFVNATFPLLSDVLTWLGLKADKEFVNNTFALQDENNSRSQAVDDWQNDTKVNKSGDNIFGTNTSSNLTLGMDKATTLLQSVNGGSGFSQFGINLFFNGSWYLINNSYDGWLFSLDTGGAAAPGMGTYTIYHTKNGSVSFKIVQQMRNTSTGITTTFPGGNTSVENISVTNAVTAKDVRASTVNASGNVTGNFIKGDGSQLTNLGVSFKEFNHTSVNITTTSITTWIPALTLNLTAGKHINIECDLQVNSSVATVGVWMFSNVTGATSQNQWVQYLTSLTAVPTYVQSNQANTTWQPTVGIVLDSPTTIKVHTVQNVAGNYTLSYRAEAAGMVGIRAGSWCRKIET